MFSASQWQSALTCHLADPASPSSIGTNLFVDVILPTADGSKGQDLIGPSFECCFVGNGVGLVL